MLQLHSGLPGDPFNARCRRPLNISDRSDIAGPLNTCLTVSLLVNGPFVFLISGFSNWCSNLSFSVEIF